MPRSDKGQRHAPGAGRRRQPLAVAEDVARQILTTQSLQAAAVALGISPSCAYDWRQRLGIGNPHVPQAPRPFSKGLTLDVLRTLLETYGAEFSLRLVARQVGCSHQAAHSTLLRLEQRGLVQAVVYPSGRRKGWAVVEPHTKKEA